MSVPRRPHLCIEPELVRKLDKDLGINALDARPQSAGVGIGRYYGMVHHRHAVECLTFPSRQFGCKEDILVLKYSKTGEMSIMACSRIRPLTHLNVQIAYFALSVRPSMR